MTARDLITRALRVIGVLAQGESPTAGETQDALLVLQDMLATWGLQRRTIYTIDRSIFALTVGTQTYTLGTWVGTLPAPASHWEHVRPVWVQHASLIVNTNAPQPLELPLDILTVEDWQAVRVKAVASTIPRVVYINEGWPYTEVSLWPIPSDTSAQAVLYLPVAVTGFADLSTDYTFPPGYADALRYQLAARLAPEFGRVLDPMVAQLAADSLAAVKRANEEPVELRMDPALTGSHERRTWNWMTGQPL